MESAQVSPKLLQLSPVPTSITGHGGVGSSCWDGAAEKCCHCLGWEEQKPPPLLLLLSTDHVEKRAAQGKHPCHVGT